MPKVEEIIAKTVTDVQSFKSDSNSQDALKKLDQDVLLLRQTAIQNGQGEKGFEQALQKLNQDLHDRGFLPNLQIMGLDNNQNIEVGGLDKSDMHAEDFAHLFSDLKIPGTTAPASADNSVEHDEAKAAAAAAAGNGSDAGGSAGGGAPGGPSAGSDQGGSQGAVSDAPQTPANPVAEIPSGPAAQRLVQAAQQELGQSVEGGHDGEHCLAGVARALDLAGLNPGGPNCAYAYQYADNLAHSSKFQEIPANSPLQPGDVVVHSPSSYSPTAGHIAIVMPGGKEISDIQRNLIGPGQNGSGDTSRVFRPKG